MNHNSVSELIERLRQQLNQTAEQADDLTQRKVIELSQRLDILIMHAQRMKREGYVERRNEKRIAKERTLCRFSNSWMRKKERVFKICSTRSTRKEQAILRTR